MANYGYAGHGFSLKALLEDPSLQTAPNLNGGNGNLKKTDKAGGYMPDVTSAFLGPRWNKSPSGEDGSEFNLEYMDLDEFLSENGIPINLEDNDDAETISLLANALARTPPRSPNREPPGIPIGPPSPRGSISPSSPQLPALAQSQKVKESSTLGLYLPESPVTKQNVSPLSLSPAVSPRTEQEPSAIERYLLDDNFGVKLSKQISIEEITSSPSKYVTKRKASFTEKIHEVQVSTIPVFMQRETPLPIRTPEYSPQPHSDVWEDSNIVNDQSESSSDSNDSFVPQNSVPGTENFDPKNRKFTEEELKPQPIIKKSKKVFVEDSSKDDRYWQRRKKNNVAAKRSRDARRVKENQIAMRAAFLEQENDEMREELERVQKENEELIKRLSKYEEV